MTGYSGLVGALDERSNLFDELVTRELQIIWEHSFQKVDENSGDGITSKFFDYSGVTRNGPDVDVPEGGYIATTERGDYGAGQPVVAGGACFWNQPPQGDQDSYLGYYDRAAGVGYGAGYKYFNDGEDGASSAGAQMYAFEQDGLEASRNVVPQEDWNINKLDGTKGEGPDVDPTDGVTLRLPHACYGHSASVVVVGVKKDPDADIKDGHLRRISDAFELYPVHVFNTRGQTMWTEFDLPFVFETTGSQANGFKMGATACHYEGEVGRATKRLNGAVWSVLKNGGNALSVPAFPGWQYVMSFRKRAGWEATEVSPSAFTLVNDNDLEVQFTRGATLSNTAYGLPPDTSTEESAVEYDLVSWDIGAGSQKGTNTSASDRGEREFITLAPADKNTPTTLASSLDEVTLVGQEPLSMFVRRASANATVVSGAKMGNGGGF